MRYKKFQDTKINYKDMEQSLLNIEERTRTNFFSWNGQFSPQFINELLKRYAKEGDKILDPFLGSGTTLCECANLQLEAQGVELNPSAYHMSKIYELCNMKLADRELLINNVKYCINSMQSEYISEIKKIDDVNIRIIMLLLVIMIDDGNVEKSSLNKELGKVEKIVMNMPFSNNRVLAFNGDARILNFENGYFDLVVTSPPYINVYNYHQQYRKATESLGYNVLSTAVSEIGSNRKNRTNRFHTVIQYCIDLSLVFKEIVRVSADEARLIFVVGRSSKVLGIDFCNSKLVYEIMIRIFRLKLLLRQERYFCNRFGKIIYEDIIHVENNKLRLDMSEKEIVTYAKKIAKEYLIEKLNKLNDTDKNFELLNGAIDNINSIEKSNYNMPDSII